MRTIVWTRNLGNFPTMLNEDTDHSRTTTAPLKVTDPYEDKLNKMKQNPRSITRYVWKLQLFGSAMLKDFEV